jgi:hypothetical protein
MADVNYEGIGKNREEADKKLYAVAAENGMLGVPKGLLYQCEVHGVAGTPHTDYALAFASALEEGSLMSSQVNLNKVNVTVTGTYETRDKKRPVGSGPIATGRASDSITDLV